MDKYEILGSVEVSNDNLNRSKKDLMRYARSEVRKMGGDALINVEIRVGTVGALSKTPSSSATRWESERPYDRNQGLPTDGRGKAVITVKGRVVRWSDRQP